MHWSCSRCCVAVEMVFELGRAHHAQRRVSTTTVVKHFDVCVNRQSSGISSGPSVSMDQLSLDQLGPTVVLCQLPVVSEKSADLVYKRLGLWREDLATSAWHCRPMVAGLVHLGLLAIHPSRERREKELKAEVVTCHARSLGRRKSSGHRGAEFSDTTPSKVE